MKPKIDTKIYILFNCCCQEIIEDVVEYLGKDSFITENQLDSSIVDEYKIPLLYEDYNVTWFKSLNKALKKLRSYVNKGEEIRQVDDKCWGIYEK